MDARVADLINDIDGRIYQAELHYKVWRKFANGSAEAPKEAHQCDILKDIYERHRRLQATA